MSDGVFYWRARVVRDTSALGSTDTTIIPVKRTTTGSCRILYYREEGSSFNNSAASRFITKISKKPTGGAGSEARLGQGNDGGSNELFSDLKLKIDNGIDQGLFVEMRILITSMTLTMSVGEICAADIQFQSNGAVTGLDL